MTAKPVNTGRKQEGARFRPGRSGNPRGKPRGARHATTRLAEKLLAADVEGVVNAVLEAAKGGDMTAARIVMDRMVPLRKGAPVSFAMPEITTAADVDQALVSIAGLMAAGELSPDEAATAASVVELRRKSIETHELERRLGDIEARLNSGKERLE